MFLRSFLRGLAAAAAGFAMMFFPIFSRIHRPVRVAGYFLVAIFLPATGLAGPFRVRALVFVR